MNIKHNLGDNQNLFVKYGVTGISHTGKTDELCEVIRVLETSLPTNSMKHLLTEKQADKLLDQKELSHWQKND